MSLDDHDLYVLGLTGNPQELAPEVFGETIKGASNAEKYMIGTRKYLRHKQSLSEDDTPIHYKREFAKDGSRFIEKLVLLSEADMENPASLLKKMGLDPVQWELIDAVFDAKSWQVTMKLYQSEIGDDEKRARVPDKVHKETNWAYNCKIRVKPTQNLITVDTMRSVFEGLTIPKLAKYKYSGGDKMLEANIPDAHIGLHAWENETGEANYDVKIAVSTYKSCVLEGLAKVKQYGLSIERILYPVGQDFFHIDNKNETTTAGTQVNTDGRWQKIYKEGTDLLMWTVEQFRAIAPVEVFHIPGNHDEMLSYFAVLHLWQAYKDIESVDVDTSETSRKYRQYGKVGLGFSHGREEGKRIDTTMQEEESKMWGDTVYREYHISDQHKEEVREPVGLKVRLLPSIAPASAWSAGKAYKGLRMAQFLVWDKDKGLDTVINAPIVKEQ